MRRLLSTGDVVEITGIRPTTLSRWVEAGLITPVDGGGGKGNHRRFSFGQVVGIRFCMKWRDWGAGQRLLTRLIRNVTAIPDDKMVLAFAEGRTHLNKIPDGKPEKPVADGEMYDLALAFREVEAAVERIVRRKRRRKPGQRRGLAENVNQ